MSARCKGPEPWREHAHVGVGTWVRCNFCARVFKVAKIELGLASSSDGRGCPLWWVDPATWTQVVQECWRPRREHPPLTPH
jgi:hypothetical protein